MLTEDQVHRSFRLLFANGELSEESLAKGESLLEDLRPESPLRHRLTSELDELRRLAVAKS